MKARILGLAFLAILLINAIALTATASAEVLLTTLLPAPIKPIKFTNEGGKSELVPLGTELKNAKNVKCVKAKSNGEFTTSQLGKVTIKFEGCKLGETKCKDLFQPEASEIIETKGELHLQTGILAAKQVPAFVVLPEKLHFLCGSLVLFLILQSESDPSCVAGEILKPNTLTKEVLVDFKEELNTKGDQDITKVFNDKDVEYKCQLDFEVNESGILQDGAIVFEEEVKAKEFREEEKGTLKEVLIDF